VAHLIDDLGDTHLRTQVVAGHRDRDAALVEPTCHMAERRRIERAPVAAVDEEREGRGLSFRRKEQTDRLARARAVAEAEFGVPRSRGRVAIGRGAARLGGKNLRMLRHPGAVVVLGLVIDRHGALSATTRSLRYRASRGKPRTFERARTAL
jgi:hypothetical protein